MYFLKNFIFWGLTLFFVQFSHSESFVPKNGFVPNRDTAIKIAEAVLAPIYGQETIDSEKPFRVILVDKVWVVEGKELPPDMLGGTFIIKISKEDGRVLFLSHYQ